jgi:hypothetical protein
MSEIIAIVGQTGTGKSTSIENLDPKETAIIGCTNKPLPFRGWKKNYVAGKGGNYLISADSATIVKGLKALSENRQDIKTIIIDDFQYLMSTEFMNRSDEKGANGWDKYIDIARHAWDVITVSRELREDIKVFILTHDETVQENFAPKRKIKTVGKMLDEKVTLEGLFTVVLFTDVTKNQETGLLDYRFITQNDGSTTGKSPKGMFEELHIPNDLVFVSEKIDTYNEGE